MQKAFLLFVYALFLSLNLWGQEQRREFHVYYQVYFPDGRTEWAPGADFAAFVADSLSGVDVLSARVDGYASPTGTLTFNRELACVRASTVAKYLLEAGIPAEAVTVRSHGEDWDGLLKTLGASGLSAAEVAAVREGIEAISPEDSVVRDGGRVYSAREVWLQSYRGGSVYRMFSGKIFPMLRRTDVSIAYRRKGVLSEPEPTIVPAPTPVPVEEIPEPEPEPVPAIVPEPDPVEVSEPEPEPEPVVETVSPEQAARGFIVCTNFVLDAALIPNVGTVVPLGKGWALDLRYGGAWWSLPQKDFWWRAYGGELGIRKYFPRKEEIDEPWRTVSGHHLGLYGQFFTYDFELGGDGQMGGTPKMNIFDNPQYAGGLEYGYTFELGRNFNLDLSFGLGYAGGLYHEYEPWNGKYVWRSTMRRVWFGPTRAEITLQWLLGSARNPQRKEVNHD